MGVSLVDASAQSVRAHRAHERPLSSTRETTPEPVWWFGGGMDLTPYYGFDEDADHFHRVPRRALRRSATACPRWKQAWCDYFYLKHRRRPRGVGGIFFDDLERGFDRSFAIDALVGDASSPPTRRSSSAARTAAFGERASATSRLYRRGRYVEFNLVWDRGTLFGLQSTGRTEAILMSMPPVVRWRYDWTPRQARRGAPLRRAGPRNGRLDRDA